MTKTEQMLRAAFVWALNATRSDGIIKHQGPFNFVAAGSVKIGDRTIHCPLLWWEDRGRRVTVSTSPGGRVLHYVDAYEHHFARLEMKLPREFYR